MMTASIYGRLGRDVKEIQTRTGKPMAVVGVAVEVGGQEEAHTLWLDLVAFGGMAEKLLKHQKADMVSASGRIALNQWTDNNGQARETWQMIVDNLVSARTTRPGGKRKARVQSGQEPPPADDAPFNDRVPF